MKTKSNDLSIEEKDKFLQSVYKHIQSNDDDSSKIKIIDDLSKMNLTIDNIKHKCGGIFLFKENEGWVS